MKRMMVAALSVFLLATGCADLDAEASIPQERATWLWNPWMIVSDEASTLSFLEGKDVTKVYVQIDPEVPVKVYRSFIEKASNKGISVYALDGAADWVAPKGYESQNKLMTWLAGYQKGATTVQRFDGIHLDVEPYLYSGWNTKQAATVTAYQALLTKAKSSATALKIPLEVDMPFWFDEISYKNTYGKGNLAEWVIAKTDGVTIMAYRDAASSIVDITKNEVALAGKYKKSLVVGVETGQTDEGDAISFFEEGEAYMNEQLHAVKTKLGNTSGFKGVAIHHVDSWKTMKP